MTRYPSETWAMNFNITNENSAKSFLYQVLASPFDGNIYN